MIVVQVAAVTRSAGSSHRPTIVMAGLLDPASGLGAVSRDLWFSAADSLAVAWPQESDAINRKNIPYLFTLDKLRWSVVCAHWQPLRLARHFAMAQLLQAEPPDEAHVPIFPSRLRVSMAQVRRRP